MDKDELNDIVFSEDDDINEVDSVSNDSDIVSSKTNSNKTSAFKKVSLDKNEPMLVIEAPDVPLKPFGRKNKNVTVAQPNIKKTSKQATEKAVMEIDHLGDLPGDIVYNMMENLENSLHEKKESVKNSVKSGVNGIVNGVMAGKFSSSNMRLAQMENGNAVYIVPGTIVMDTTGNMVMMNNNCDFVSANQSSIAQAAFNAGMSAARNALLQKMTPTEAINKFGFTQDEINMAINGGNQVSQSQQPTIDENVPQQIAESSGHYSPAMDARRRRAAAFLRNINLNNQRIDNNMGYNKDNDGPSFDF